MQLRNALISPLRVPFSLVAALSLIVAGLFQAPYALAGSEAPDPTAKGGSTSDTLCPMGFGDVQPGAYYYDAVHNLYCMGAVTGYADNLFRPGNPTTRGQLSKIAVLARQLPLNTSGGPHFRDVPPTHPFYQYIETAYLRGAISGYSDGTFRPDSLVTRGQLAKLVVTINGWPGRVAPSPMFNDVATNNPFYLFIETAALRGVLSGYDDHSFRPSGFATRGQIVKVIYLSVNGANLTPLEQETVDLINGRRAALGLGPLRPNAALTMATRRHSEDIGPAGLCQHNGTDGSSPWDRIAQAGYTGGAMGEVVGCGFSTPSGVVDGWWGSPAHYAILTDPNANDIGCGWWVSPTGAGWQTCATGHSD